MKVPNRVSRYGGALKRFSDPKICWKVVDTAEGQTILEGEVPAGSPVVYPANKGAWNKISIRVKRFIPLATDNGQEFGWSPVNERITYQIGVEVQPDTFDPNPENVSTNGIHCWADHRAAKHWLAKR